jgi:hypothetical protein
MAKSDQPPVLSATTIRVWAGALFLAAIVSCGVLLFVFQGGDQRDSVRLDAIRTAGSIVVGTGGGAALLLAARRQRSTELGLRQTDHDATERRVTELYSKAADQLGSDKAPVRLAGIYALERLAQNNADHRQTIVNLYCAYLRMPFEPCAERSEEHQVRRAAQDVLVSHLRPGEEHWADMEVNLSRATLVGFAMTHCAVRSARFNSTRFVQQATFRGSTFRTVADFRHATFTGLADFRRVRADGADVSFRAAEFEEEVDFGEHTAVPVAGAVTRTVHPHRKWPAGWQEKPLPQRPEWAVLVPDRRTVDPSM